MPAQGTIVAYLDFWGIREHELAGQLSFGAPTDYTPTALQTIHPQFQRKFPHSSPIIILEPSRVLRPRMNAGNLGMSTVAQEIGRSEGVALCSEKIALFGITMEHDRTLRGGLLGTDSILQDQALARLTALDGGFNLVHVASLHETVEAVFLLMFLSDGFKRSTSIIAEPLDLTFSLITRRTSDNFGRTFQD